MFKPKALNALKQKLSELGYDSEPSPDKSKIDIKSRTTGRLEASLSPYAAWEWCAEQEMKDE